MQHRRRLKQQRQEMVVKDNKEIQGLVILTRKLTYWSLKDGAENVLQTGHMQGWFFCHLCSTLFVIWEEGIRASLSTLCCDSVKWVTGLSSQRAGVRVQAQTEVSHTSGSSVYGA